MLSEGHISLLHLPGADLITPIPLLRMAVVDNIARVCLTPLVWGHLETFLLLPPGPQHTGTSTAVSRVGSTLTSCWLVPSFTPMCRALALPLCLKHLIRLCLTYTI